MPTLPRRYALAAIPILSLGCLEFNLPPTRTVRDTPDPRGTVERREEPPREAVEPSELPRVEGGPFKSRIAITLSPSRSSGPRVDRLDVALGLSGDASSASLPLTLTLRETDLGESGWAARIEALSAEDEKGPLEMQRDDAPWTPHGVPRAIWRSDRPRVGDVQIRYRVRVPAPAETRTNFGLYGDSVGLGGPARTFLLLPPASGAFQVALRWGLGGLSRGATGACRHGEGDVAFSSTLQDLEREVVLAGPLTTTTLPDGDGTLRAVWLGTPAFDRESLLPLVAKVRRAAERTFGVATPRPLVLVRTQEHAPGGSGIADDDALMLLFSPRNGFSADTRLTIAHEAIHAWIGHALRVAGDPDATWFTEGFTVHYSRKLLVELGELSKDELIGELQRQGAMYAQAALRLVPGESLAVTHAGASAPSMTPYAHGGFYAAELEAKLRDANGGATTLDDFLRQLFTSGTPVVPLSRFRDRVEAALGDAGGRRFDAVVRDGLPADPPSDAFGPCFRRTSRSAVPAPLLAGDVPLLAWERTSACRGR